MELTDASGNKLERYEYDPYGRQKTYQLQGSNWVQAFQSSYQSWYGYTGRRHDPESGLMYYRNRYYSPYLGRFLTQDPIGNWGDGANWGNGYASVGNQGQIGLDPLGLTTWNYDPGTGAWTFDPGPYRIGPQNGKDQAGGDWGKTRVKKRVCDGKLHWYLFDPRIRDWRDITGALPRDKSKRPTAKSAGWISGRPYVPWDSLDKAAVVVDKRRLRALRKILAPDVLDSIFGWIDEKLSSIGQWARDRFGPLAYAVDAMFSVLDHEFIKLLQDSGYDFGLIAYMKSIRDNGFSKGWLIGLSDALVNHFTGKVKAGLMKDCFRRMGFTKKSGLKWVRWIKKVNKADEIAKAISEYYYPNGSKKLANKILRDLRRGYYTAFPPKRRQ